MIKRKSTIALAITTVLWAVLGRTVPYAHDIGAILLLIVLTYWAGDYMYYEYLKIKGKESDK